jgi:hypothetical protein
LSLPGGDEMARRTIHFLKEIKMKKVLAIMFSLVLMTTLFANDGLEWKFVTGAAGSTKLNTSTIPAGKNFVLRAICLAIKNATNMYVHTGSNDDIAGATDIFDYIFFPNIDSDGNDDILYLTDLYFVAEAAEDAYVWFENDPGCYVAYKYEVTDSTPGE